MTAIDYTEDVRAAAEDIRDAGRIIQIVRQSAATGSNPYDRDPAPAPDVENVWALETSWHIGEVDGTTIRATDRKFLIAAEGVSTGPTEQDALRIDGADINIANVQPLAPGGVVILWKVAVRG